jgi:uncharacterized protein (DUF1684 family)
MPAQVPARPGHSRKRERAGDLGAADEVREPAAYVDPGSRSRRGYPSAMTDSHTHGDHDDHGEHHHHEHVDYGDAVRAYRADKDEFLRTNRGSPIPAAERATFEGLPYFEIDEGRRFEGLTLEPYAGDEPARFQIPTTDGQLRDAERAGVFRFDIDGSEHRLTAYTFAGGGPESVFVPFLDQTSGTESYGAGRYLDIDREHDGTYALDFNLAYHPSCVYDPKYSCPLTPAENRLPIRIEVGERLPA